jgi:hypothetical protein
MKRAAREGCMMAIMEVYMNQRFSFPPGSGIGPITPMVYVKEKTVWEYKLLSRNLSKEEAPSEEELNRLGKEAWELAGVFTDSPFVHFYFKRLKD